MIKNDRFKSPVTNEMKHRLTILSKNHKTKDVTICAWCEGQSKYYSKQYKNKGYEVSHGMCDKYDHGWD